MNNTAKVIVAVVAVAAIAGGVFVFMGKDSPASSSTTSSSSTTEQSSSSTTDTQAVALSYTDSGFSPSEVTVPADGKLTVTNNSSGTIEPSSDPHPVHTANPQLNFGEIKAGASKTVTLTTKGNWGMHNHYHTSHHVTVVVD